MEQTEFEFAIQRLDHLGIVAGLCHDMRSGSSPSQIDAAMGSSERKVVSFQMAGVVCLERDAEGNWAVRWALTPELV